MKLFIGLLLIAGAAAATPAGEYSFKATTAESLRGEAAQHNTCETAFPAKKHQKTYVIKCSTWASAATCHTLCEWAPVKASLKIPGNHCCIEARVRSANNGPVDKGSLTYDGRGGVN